MTEKFVTLLGARMKRIELYFAAICILVCVVVTTPAQSVKYDRTGNLTWISNLLEDKTGCEASRLFTGKITKAEVFPGDSAYGFEFTLRAASGKPQKFIASLSRDEGALLADFEEMLQPNRRLKVKARQCGSGGFWTAEDIWRL